MLWRREHLWLWRRTRNYAIIHLDCTYLFDPTFEKALSLLYVKFGSNLFLFRKNICCQINTDERDFFLISVWYFHLDMFYNFWLYWRHKKSTNKARKQHANSTTFRFVFSLEVHLDMFFNFGLYWKHNKSTNKSRKQHNRPFSFSLEFSLGYCL